MNSCNFSESKTRRLGIWRGRSTWGAKYSLQWGKTLAEVKPTLNILFTAKIFFFWNHKTLYNYFCKNAQKNNNNKLLICCCCAEVFKGKAKEWGLQNCSNLCVSGAWEKQGVWGGAEPSARLPRWVSETQEWGVLGKRGIAGYWKNSWCSCMLKSGNWEYTPEQQFGMRELNITPRWNPTWNKHEIRKQKYSTNCCIIVRTVVSFPWWVGQKCWCNWQIRWIPRVNAV